MVETNENVASLKSDGLPTDNAIEQVAREIGQESAAVLIPYARVSVGLALGSG
jgi:methenyltetrahydromethanopterin cyclohydrolase